MTWLINTTAKPTLTIGGEDYSDLLVSMTVNDQSVNNTGMMLTTGTINLVEQPGGHRLEDYSKEKFGRGQIVLLDLTIDGQTRRHPRGYLYLLDSTYNNESRSQELTVGCILTLYNLTDNIENLRGFSVFKLPKDATFSDLDSALQTEGKFLWQNNQGQILKRSFFGSDGGGSNKYPAAWVSVRDYTALASSPLGAGSVVPDTVEVGYSWVETVEDQGNSGCTGPISDVNVIAGGTGYVDGTTADVELSGGSGTGAKATVVVSGGGVVTVTITKRGQTYKKDDRVYPNLPRSGSGDDALIKVSDADCDEPNPDGKPYDEDIMESTYWLEHPAQLKKKQVVCQTLRSGLKECRTITVNDAKKTFSVRKTSLNRRNYGGTGGSVTTETSITQGPACELQGAYYAEYYAWEVAKQGGNFGGIKLKGLETVVQNKSEKVYTYGSGGEVIKTVEYRYQNMLSAMTQNDWRPGGAEVTTGYDPFNPPLNTGRGFLVTPPKDKMFMQSKLTTTYQYNDETTISLEETLQSSAQCNGVGIFPPNGARVLQNIDADNNGTLTTTKRTSRGAQLNPDQPPRNPGDDPDGDDSPCAPPQGYSNVTHNAIYTEESTKYSPTAAGSITFNTQMPYNVPCDKEAAARNRASNYAKTQRALIEGDAAGVRVAEAMRPEIFGYYPGMPFSFVDRTEAKVVKLRMNGSGWALSNNEALFSTDGCFIGLSNGTPSIGSNVPDPINPGIKSTPEQRAAAYDPPVIEDETGVDLGRGDQPDVTEVIGIDIPVALGTYTGFGDDGLGIVPQWKDPIDITVLWDLQCYVSGEKVAAEAVLLEVDGIGTLPESSDTLLTGPSGVLIPDLFDPSNIGLPEKTMFVTVGAPITDQTFFVMTGPQPPGQIFSVETGAPPPDVTFMVDTRQVWQIDVAESPFMVTVFADPVPEGNIFDVRTSATPADRIFDVSVMATPPESTPNGQTFQVITGQTYEITVDVAVPDFTYLISTGQRPAPDPDYIFGVSVGGDDAPPIPDPHVIHSVRVSYQPPDQLFRFLVVDEMAISAGEPAFTVITSATPSDFTFMVETGAPPVNPANIFNVTAQAEGANRIFDVNVIQKYDVRMNANPLNYQVQDGTEAGIYRVTGHGLVYAVNPEIRGYVGQNLQFTVDTPANPLWITAVNDNSGTPVTAEQATVLGNGSTTGVVRCQFHQAGQYYYASDSPDGPICPLIIEELFAPDPLQTFAVTIGARAVDPDNSFAITTSAQPADVNHIVIAFAKPAGTTFDVKVIENVTINAVDQVFNIGALDQVFNVTRVNLRDVTVADRIDVAVLDGVIEVAVLDDLIEVAALDDLFEVEASEP